MKDNDIQSIINYWINTLYDKYKHNNIYDFLPLMPFVHNSEYSYAPDPRMFIKNDFSAPYEFCLFVKREDIKYTLINEFGFIKYSNNIAHTANLLWENRLDKQKYCFVWLYAFCVNLINNKDNIPIMSNETFCAYIQEMMIKLGEHTYANELQLTNCYSHNNKHNLKSVPDGLLFSNHYKINENDINITKQLAKILLTEMLYILNTNYLIVY